MTTEKVIEIMESIRNGSIGTIEYKSSLPINKDAKKAGISVYCTTKKMVQFGVDYKNLVKDIASAETTPRANNYTWIIDNKVSHNSKTEKDYVRVTNIDQKTLSREYSIVKEDSVTNCGNNFSLIAEFLQPSYANKSGEKPLVQNISVDNVIAINGVQ